MNHYRLAITVALLLVLPAPARAHFLWLVQSNDNTVALYFSETAEPGDPDLLERIKNPIAWRMSPTNATQKLTLQRQGDVASAAFSSKRAEDSVFVLRHDYGVLERGGEAFVLRYYAKTGPALGNKTWAQLDGSKHVDLDVIPKRTKRGLQLRVLWHGQPLSGAQVKISAPGLQEVEKETNKEGLASIPISTDGTYSIRARHIEQKKGSSNGKQFNAIRHYATLALPVRSSRLGNKILPVLPKSVTSFGAAITGNALFIYGGHTGRAHEYYNEAQENTLRRLDLKSPKAWESLETGPRLQGLAMVAHNGKLYRIGGFTAKNKDGQEHDLWSQAGVASYDTRSKHWSDLSPLPEPRSSFDAAVLGGTLYVIGGWNMQGDADKQWHNTAYALDLTSEKLNWSALPKPPFERRALAVAAHGGKLYAIGGMQREGGPTTRVDVFDPTSRKWTLGPSLQGKGMEGFGCSAFATGERLYVTTMKGNLQRLSKDGKSWEIVRQLTRARFFHRMLPYSESQLLSVGGASMSEGRFEQIDVLDVDD